MNSSSENPRSENHPIGAEGEESARTYLERAGLRTVAANFRTRFGEIDLIMEDNGCLVFVEVKRRRSERYGDALEAVSAIKQRRLTRAAVEYATGKRWTGMMRFDVVAIDENGIRHVPDAFPASGGYYL